jgi:hypothetical protein
VRLNETLVEERPKVAGLRSRAMPIAGTRAIRALEIALGHDAEGADGGENLDLRRSKSVAVSSQVYGFAVTPSRKGEVARGRPRVAAIERFVTFSYSCRDTREFRETFASWLMLQAYRLQQGTRPSRIRR